MSPNRDALAGLLWSPPVLSDKKSCLSPLQKGKNRTTKTWRHEVTVQSCIKTVVFVIARSVLCDEAIPRQSIWLEKWEIALPENGSQ